MRIFICSIALAATLLMTDGVRANELRDYGEYLAGECKACHGKGLTTAIPSIAGYDAELFIVLMNAYKDGSRENPAMVSVAQALDDEQIKALSVYYASLEAE